MAEYKIVAKKNSSFGHSATCVLSLYKETVEPFKRKDSGQRDGLVVKSLYHSARGRRFTWNTWSTRGSDGLHRQLHSCANAHIDTHTHTLNEK